MQCRVRCLLLHSLAVAVLLAQLTLSAQAQTFSSFDNFLRQYEAAAPEAKTAMARSFVTWQQANGGGFPIVDAPGRVAFVYFGTGREKDVRLVGDFTPKNFFNPYWDLAGEPMTQVGSLFYLYKTFEFDARLDYRLIVDGKGILDPLNTRKLFSGTGEGDASELVMVAHRLPPEMMPRADVPHGTLQKIDEAWATPAVNIYLPPGYDPARNYPTLYTADGSAWINFMGLPATLDNLIAARAIEPVIAVFIDAAADRATWYHFNEDYLAYLKRVVGYVDGRYTTRARADARVHAGTSAGGKATAYVGFEMPNVFGNLAMLSSSLGGPLYYFEPYFSERKRPDPNLRVWMSAGTYEGSIHSEAITMEIYFKRIGIPTEAVYVHQGHSFGAWREAAVAMLKHFFLVNSTR